MKKRNKSYKPKVLRIPKLVMQHNDFEQIDRLMLMIENQNVLEAHGDVVMYSANKEIYQVAPALNAWCDYWQDISKMHNKSLNDAPLRTLINKINHNMQVTVAQIKQAKEVVDLQRNLFMGTDHNTISKVAIQHQIALKDDNHAM